MNRLHYQFWILTLIIIFSCPLLQGQDKKDMLFLDAETYNPHKYKDKIGNPYYFEHWVIGNAFDISGEAYENLFMNYNIFESQWETRWMDKIVALNPSIFWCIIIDKEYNDHMWKFTEESHVFMRGLLPKDENRFAKVIYNGKQLKLYKDMQIIESSEKLFDKGKSSVLTRLYRRDKYIIYKKGKILDAGYSLFDIINKIGHKENILKFVEDNQMKFTEDYDFTILMYHIENNYKL